MPTTPMRRIECIVTGVAGSPYYLVGYFNANVGTATQNASVWHRFLFGTVDVLSEFLPDGAQAVTGADVSIVDPVSGDVIGVEASEPTSTTGTFDGEMLPPMVQALVRWRTGIYNAGREIRGRTNVPMQVEANNLSNGLPRAELVNALNTRAAVLVGNPVAEHVVYSKKGGRWETTVAASCWDNWSVLRSRRD